MHLTIFNQYDIIKIPSLCAIMCTHDTSIITAFVIAWHFKAQSKKLLSDAKIFTNFVGGAKLAWFRWRLLVSYP